MATIIRVEPFGIGLPLRKPMRLASETIVVAENLFVRVTSSDGLVGWGEAASAPTMTGELLERMVATVRRFVGPALLSAPLDDLAALEERTARSIRANSGRKSAVVIARHDLDAHHPGVQV